jgi:hypothetical protein
MKYPRLPEKLDRRKKLMEDDIKTIRSLASQGYSKLAISKRFKVSEALIYYHCKTEEQKHAYNQRIIELHMQKLKDPDYKRHHLDLAIESKKRKRKLVPEYNDYVVEATKKCYSKSRESRKKWAEKAARWREKNPDKIKAYIEKYKPIRKIKSHLYYLAHKKDKPQ